jgi:histidinol dehydrogenase
MMEPRKLDTLDTLALDRLLQRGRVGDPEVSQTVAALVQDVRERGDAALRDHARRIDSVELRALEIPRDVWDAALAALDPDLRSALESTAGAIRRFHEAQRPRALTFEAAPGVRLGRRPDPLGRVGVYAPGGRAAYPSSVLMGVIPARVAGVAEVVVCSPAGPDGRPSAAVMAACALAGADRLFALGGASAVAALALGTETVPTVDRIVGPGNAFVTEAKRQLSAVVGIDNPAGPSELMVVADATADPAVIAVEMIAQAEHDPDAAAVLVSTDASVATATAAALAREVPRTPREAVVSASLGSAGAILVVDTLAQALDFAARYAPEHLLLLVDDPYAALERVRCAGTVFLGPTSSVAFGDYATGANHVLPTGGLARSYSGLAVDDFVRWTTWQEVGPEAAARLAPATITLAGAEGLPGHAAAARAAGRRGQRAAPGSPGRAPSAVQPRAVYQTFERYDPARRPVELDLSANTNLWGACPSAASVLESAPPPVGYPTPYADELKAAIAERWAVTPDHVVTGCGSDDLLDSAIRAFCEPGARLAFPAPTFPMVETFARMNDVEPCPVRGAPDGDLDDRAMAALAAADMVYLCRPNNPTGALLPAARVLELLADARGLVLLDEAYGEYAGESLFEPALESGRAVVLRTFSKAYGLAGLRVGYALGPPAIVGAVERSRGPYKVGGLAEQAAATAMRNGDAWVADVVAETARQRESLTTALRERGLRVFPSRANFVLTTPRHGPGNDGAPSGWAVALRSALMDRGIGIRAFPDLEGVGDAVRVTVGPEPVMDRFLDALDGVLDATGATV